MEKKIKLPLSRKIAIMVLLFAAALSVVLITVSYNHYKEERFDDYEQFAMNIAAVAASQIDRTELTAGSNQGSPMRHMKRPMISFDRSGSTAESNTCTW